MRQTVVAHVADNCAVRTVTLRDETDGPNSRGLWAYIDASGDLHIDGQDLGPLTAPVSTDGEYEWFDTISRSDIPRLLSLLGASSDADVLDVLESDWSGRKARDLERIIRESDIEVQTMVWSG